MKLLVSLFIASLLFACAVITPIELAADQSKTGFVSFATLSSQDDVIETSASVVYVKLAKYRYNAAALFRANRISLYQANKALTQSDQIRAALDKAVAKRSLLSIRSAEIQIEKAASQLELRL